MRHAARTRPTTMDAHREPFDDSEMGRFVDADLLFQELRSGRKITLIDVRRTHELRGPSGRLPGAWSIPLHQLRARLIELECHRSEPVVVISNRGVRAQRAALELELSGFTEVRTLEGGLERWTARGFPLTHPTMPPTATAETFILQTDSFR